MRTVTTLSSILLMSAFLTACGGSKKDENVKKIKSDDCLSEKQLNEKGVPLRAKNTNGCVTKIDLDDEHITIIGREDKDIKITFTNPDKNKFDLAGHMDFVRSELKEVRKGLNKTDKAWVEYRWELTADSSEGGTTSKYAKDLGFTFKGSHVSNDIDYKVKLKSMIRTQKAGSERIDNRVLHAAPSFKIYFDLREGL